MADRRRKRRWRVELGDAELMPSVSVDGSLDPGVPVDMAGVDASPDWSVQVGEADIRPDYAAMYAPYSPKVPGNIDLGRRPHARNPDGSISTVRSMGVGMNGLEYLLPTVSNDGRLMSAQEAIAEYDKTGRHLGAYGDIPASNAAGEAIHVDQERRPPVDTLSPFWETGPVQIDDWWRNIPRARIRK